MPRPPLNRSRGPGRPRGRPRRNSDSTVASIDYARLSYLPESHVLKPAEPGISSDLWTCFVLNDAVVYHKAPNGELEIANVCNIDLEGPYVIRGKLDVDLYDRDERNALLNIALADAFIEIPTSAMYAIAYPVQVWAAGKSGWFEINPASAYQPMYRTVCEGIELYYLIQFAYEEVQEAEEASRSKKVSWPNQKIERLFLAYALKLGDGVLLHEVKERCRTHSPFLLAHFQKATDFDWSKTSFMKWMKANNQDTVERLRNAAAKMAVQSPAQQHQQTSRLTGEPTAKAKSTDLPLRASPVESDRSRRSKSRASRQSQDVDIQVKDFVQPPRTATQMPVRPTMPKYTTHNPPPATVPTSLPGRHQDSSAQSPGQAHDPVLLLLELMEELLEEKGGDPAKIKEGTVHSRLYMKCSMQSYYMPPEVTHFYASQLVASLPSKWYTSPFFHWLKAKRNVPWNPQHVTAKTVASKVIRRKTSTVAGQPRARNSPADPLPSSSHAGKHYPGSPRTSGLRPTRGAKRPIFNDDYDEDGRPRKISKLSRAPDSDDDDDDDDDDNNAETGDSQEELDSNNNNNNNNNEIDTDLDISDEDGDIPNTSQSVIFAPAATSRETMKIVVRAEKIPSMLPSGPNGTWKCEEIGCKYIVRSANDPQGKELISKHFRDHENRAEKMDLALAEGNKNRLPINHLLDKIRSIGEASQRKELEALSGRLQDKNGIQFPRPIKRRLI